MEQPTERELKEAWTILKYLSTAAGLYENECHLLIKVTKEADNSIKFRLVSSARDITELGNIKELTDSRDYVG